MQLKKRNALEVSKWLWFLYVFTQHALLCLVCLQGALLATHSVFDRDITPKYPKEPRQNRYVGTMLTIDQWTNETFTVTSTFKEDKSLFGNIRGTVFEYSTSI